MVQAKSASWGQVSRAQVALRVCRLTRLQQTGNLDKDSKAPTVGVNSATKYEGKIDGMTRADAQANWPQPLSPPPATATRTLYLGRDLDQAPVTAGQQSEHGQFAWTVSRWLPSQVLARQLRPDGRGPLRTTSRQSSSSHRRMADDPGALSLLPLACSRYDQI
jgi:hypothetical protein